MRIELNNGMPVDVDVQRGDLQWMRLQIYPSGKVKLTMSQEAEEAAARAFLQTKRGWLQQQLCGEAPQQEVRWLGQTLPVQIQQKERSRVFVSKGKLKIWCVQPEEAPVLLERWWRARAMEILRKFCGIWVQRLEAEMPKLRISKMRGMWGRCDYRKQEICFHPSLLCAPPVCVEYVVLHELAHLKYPNHGERFGAFLRSNMPDWKRRQELLQRETAWIDKNIFELSSEG